MHFSARTCSLASGQMILVMPKIAVKLVREVAEYIHLYCTPVMVILYADQIFVVAEAAC